MVYSDSALTHLGAGIHKPRASANGRSYEASFFTPKFYDGLIRGASARRPRSGIVNSVKPVTLLLHNNGGSSPKLNEDTTMSKIYEVPLRLSEPQMDAFQILLLNLLETDLSDFTNGNDLLAMHAKKAAQETLNAILADLEVCND